MNKPRTDKMDVTDLDQLAGSPDFESAIDRDFGTATDNHQDGVSRRRWLQIMGASLALGGSVGCRYEEEKIAPFAFRPQNRIPGIPEKFATLLDFAGVAQPIVSTNYDGRPIKLDGNPDHPASLGASSAFTQARILEFYDPDRLREPLKKDGETFTETTWEAIESAFKPALSAANLNNVVVLAQPTSSPSLMRLQEEFTKRGGAWLTYAPISDDNARAGSKLAFGKAVRSHFKLDEAKVIVSLDADPLLMDPAAITNSISFAKGRDADHKKMSRLYAVESQFTTTGGAADHRLSVPSAKIAGFAASLAAAIEAASPGGTVDKSLPYRQRLLAAMAQDLVDNQGAGAIIVGEYQPAEVHALAHSLNEKLGNNGKSIQFSDLPDPGRSSMESIQDFAAQLSGGVETVVILGGNPVYDAPRSLKLGELLSAAKNSIHISCEKNETSLECGWVSNMAHPLEVWKDGFAFDGSVCIGQPLINPLFGGKSDIETLASLMGMEVTEGQAIVRETVAMEESDWRTAVHDGFVKNSMAEPATVSAQAAPAIAADDSWSKPWDGESIEIVFTPSSSVYDGRFANSSWMQELPNLFTKVAWDNYASVSPRTAEALGLKQSRNSATLATVIVDGKEIKIPINIQPGQADGSIGIEIGYGRTAAGRVGGDEAKGIPSIGQDVNSLRSVEAWNVASGLKKSAVIPSRTNYKLAIVQEPWSIDEVGRQEIQDRMFRNKNKNESDRSRLIREGSFESYKSFLDHHPLESDHDEHAETKPAAKQTNAVAKLGALPIINNVAYVPQEDTGHNDEAGHEGDHGHGGGGHGGHKAAWPEAFHMHHELFDITPGSREDYKNTENDGTPTSYTNVWGMSIDLNKCIGCNSCVVACQSENNVPVVGKDDVWRGREMHWIRIDRYFGNNLYTDDAEDDDEIIVQQPVACHHCENAPCETVCPVAATVHSSEGLNDMVYNRCIGTRYCGNNCPYKVRRFNFFNYSDAVTFLKYPGADKLPAGDRNLQNLMMNPEVTIRSRGVMEKCTYCVQRIQNTKIQAKNEKRDIGPNEITTACQDACPTQAIKFGDLHNNESEVAKAHANPRAYSMLEELNNIPRTKYLAKVRNPHPAMIDRDDRNSVHGHAAAKGGDAHAKSDDHDHPTTEDHDHDESETKKTENEVKHD